jgi:hypothetical protein
MAMKLSPSAAPSTRAVHAFPRNTDATDTLRRGIQVELRYGDGARVARHARLSDDSHAHQLEGRMRLSADELRGALLVIPPERGARLLTDWLAGTGIGAAALVSETRPMSLLPAAASTCSDAGRFTEAVALSIADRRVTPDEARAVESEGMRLIAKTSAVVVAARRLAR